MWREKYRSPIARSQFVFTAKDEYGYYVLFSEKYGKRFKTGMDFYDGLAAPEVGDIIELPDCMLYEYAGRPMFSVHELYFGLPNKDVAVPQQFNIEEDYAYITYKKTNRRLLLQRFYG